MMCPYTLLWCDLYVLVFCDQWEHFEIFKKIISVIDEDLLGETY